MYVYKSDVLTPKEKNYLHAILARKCLDAFEKNSELPEFKPWIVNLEVFYSYSSIKYSFVQRTL